MVVEISVKIVAGLHQRQHALLRALGANGLVDLERGGIHGAVSRAAIENDVDARGCQFFAREERSLAELGDVGEDGHAHGLAKLGVHRGFGHRFGEDHVGAGCHVGLRALDGTASPSLASASVRAMMTNCGSVRASTGGLDAIDHLFSRHQFLAGPMAAALGAHLVFDVHRSRAGLDHLADGARNVEGPAPAGVDIDQQRQRGRRR